MKRFEDATTTDEMINIEVQKINSGSRNESNLLRVIYLDDLGKQIEDIWKKSGRSNDKEELQYLWRAIENEIEWLKTLLLQGKSIAMTADLDALESMRNVDMKGVSNEQINELRDNRNNVKADFYVGVSKYDNFASEKESFKKNNLYDSRIDLGAKDVLKRVEKMNEKSRLEFWFKYFKMADKFIYYPKFEAVEKPQRGE